MRYSSSNPILSSRNFDACLDGDVATLAGTIQRCLILLVLVFGSAMFSWSSAMNNVASLGGKLTLFAILAFVAVITASIKKEWSGIVAPLYAICEGLVLGALSRLFEMAYPGIVIQAVLLTFGVAFGMLALYKTGVIHVNDKFRMIVGSALFGIFMFYMISWILSFFHVAVPLIHSSGIGGILFSVFVVIVAALYLAIDFDFIVQVANRGMPKYMSWYAALGLMVSLVWLYMEILRLLSKIRDR